MEYVYVGHDSVLTSSCTLMPVLPLVRGEHGHHTWSSHVRFLHLRGVAPALHLDATCRSLPILASRHWWWWLWCAGGERALTVLAMGMRGVPTSSPPALIWQ